MLNTEVSSSHVSASASKGVDNIKAVETISAIEVDLISTISCQSDFNDNNINLISTKEDFKSSYIDWNLEYKK